TAAFKDLFPPGTDQGETRALPAIFQNRDGFNAAVTKFETDARSAKAAVKDEASLKAEMPKVLANCGSCHTGFRKPQ
ncbi:MAG: cytochrome c, partial [Beijerinckiaceae bacterium]